MALWARRPKPRSRPRWLERRPLSSQTDRPPICEGLFRSGGGIICGPEARGEMQAQALAIIDAQIGVAITMLRQAAKDLQRGSRSTATRDLFLEIFRVRPEFVPTWLKTTATIKDRGDVVATRCKRVADLLASGKIKFLARSTRPTARTVRTTQAAGPVRVGEMITWFVWETFSGTTCRPGIPTPCLPP